MFDHIKRKESNLTFKSVILKVFIYFEPFPDISEIFLADGCFCSTDSRPSTVKKCDDRLKVSKGFASFDMTKVEYLLA